MAPDGRSRDRKPREQHQEPHEKAPPDSPDPTALTEGLLDQVLDEMEAAAAETSATDAIDLAVLAGVARKYAGATLVFDPIFIELVEAMLTNQFGKTAPSENWNAIARQVAERLYDDPQSHRRVHKLWQRLAQVPE